MPEIHIVFVFEVAQAIDLDRTEHLLSGAERPALRHRGRATALFQYRPAPLRIAQEGSQLSIGTWKTDPIVDLVLYDFGTASAAYHMPIEGDMDTLHRASVALRESDAAREDARARVDRVLRSIPSGLTKPRVAEFTEDYVIFGLRTPPDGMTAAEFCDRHARQIARILRPDSGEPSAQEIADATELRISFGPSDFTIVDWDGAFVIDPDPEDVRAVLEFANVQLLEMRWLDL